MITNSYFHSQTWTEALLKDRVIAVVTEYTIFKLDLAADRVLFNCLLGEYSFEIVFEEIQKELNSKQLDFSEAMLETIITYCAVISKVPDKMLYPVCEFDTLDDLFDWFLQWANCSEEERREFLEEL